MYMHGRLATLFALAFAVSSVAPYSTELYSDGLNAAMQQKQGVLDTRTIDASTTLKLKLAPGGGAAIRIVPAD
jgi:hypothetical protein